MLDLLALVGSQGSSMQIKYLVLCWFIFMGVVNVHTLNTEQTYILVSHSTTLTKCDCKDDDSRGGNGIRGEKYLAAISTK